MCFKKIAITSLLAALFLMAPWSFVVAQKGKDSLLNVLNQATTPDSSKIRILLALADLELRERQDSSHFFKAKSYQERALALARKYDHRWWEAKALYWEGKYYAFLNHPAKRTKVLAQAAKLFEASGDVKEESACYVHMLSIYESVKDSALLIQASMKILTMQERLKKIKIYNPIYCAYYGLGDHYRRLNKRDSSNYYLRKAISFSQTYKTVFSQAYVLLAYNQIAEGAFNDAVTIIKELSERAKLTGDDQTEMWAWATLGTVYDCLRYYSKSEAAFTKAENIAHKISPERESLYRFCKLVQMYRVSLNPKLLDSLHVIFQQQQHINPCDLWMETLGDLYAEGGYNKKALAFFSYLIKASSACEDTMHLMQALSRKAEILMKNGRYKEARPLVRRAFEIINKNRSTEVFYDVYLLMGRMEIATGNFREGERLIHLALSNRDSLDYLKVQGMERLTQHIEAERNHSTILTKDNEILRKEQENRKLYLFLILTLLIGVAILVVLRFEKHRILQKTHELTQFLGRQLDDLSKVLESEEIDNNLHGHVQFSIHTINQQIADMKALTDSPEEKLKRLHILINKQKEINQTIKMSMTQKEDALRSFNYTVGHDLKAPLTNAEHFLNLLEIYLPEPQNAQVVGNLTHLRDVISDMKMMIDGIQRYSQADGLALDYQQIDLNTLLKSITHRIAAKSHGQYPTLHIGPLPILYGDPLLVRQAFYNIIENSYKFTSYATAPCIHISGAVSKEIVQIKIQDNGAGFPPNSSEHIFKLFSTSHQRSQFKGNGVGLAIVRRIIERHGGKVWAESQGLGTGSTFFVEMPLSSEQVGEHSLPVFDGGNK